MINPSNKGQDEPYMVELINLFIVDMFEQPPIKHFKDSYEIRKSFTLDVPKDHDEYTGASYYEISVKFQPTQLEFCDVMDCAIECCGGCQIHKYKGKTPKEVFDKATKYAYYTPQFKVNP